MASVTTVLPGVQRDPDVAALALPGGFGSAGHVVVFVDQDASVDWLESVILPPDSSTPRVWRVRWRR